MNSNNRGDIPIWGGYDRKPTLSSSDSSSISGVEFFFIDENSKDLIDLIVACPGALTVSGKYSYYTDYTYTGIGINVRDILNSVRTSYKYKGEGYAIVQVLNIAGSLKATSSRDNYFDLFVKDITSVLDFAKQVLDYAVSSGQATPEEATEDYRIFSELVNRSRITESEYLDLLKELKDEFESNKGNS